MLKLQILIHKNIKLFVMFLSFIMIYLTIIGCDEFLYGSFPKIIETSIASLIFSIIILIIEYEDLADYSENWLWNHTHKEKRK